MEPEQQAGKTEGNTTQILEHNGQARAVSVMSGAALLAQCGASGSKRNSAQRRRPAWIELRPCHARRSSLQYIVIPLQLPCQCQAHVGRGEGFL